GPHGSVVGRQRDDGRDAPSRNRKSNAVTAYVGVKYPDQSGNCSGRNATDDRGVVERENGSDERRTNLNVVERASVRKVIAVNLNVASNRPRRWHQRRYVRNCGRRSHAFTPRSARTSSPDSEDSRKWPGPTAPSSCPRTSTNTSE